MLRSAACLLIFFFFTTTLAAQSYKKIYRKAVVVDTHNDVISTVVMRGMNIENDLTGKTHTDIRRLLKSGLDVQVFSIFSDERFGKDTAFKYANIEIDSLYAIRNRHPHEMKMVYHPGDLKKAVRSKQLGIMMGLEGGHMIEDNLQNLDSLYTRGVRYMTLTWNNSTSWASSAWDETTGRVTNKGLNELGKQIVERMNALGMMVDLSHVGEKTFWDVMAITTKPVIVSHSCAWTLCPVPRNLKDEQIRAVAKNGGVIHVNFYSGFIDSNFNKRKNAFIATHSTEADSLKALKKPNYEIEEIMMQKYPAEAEALRPSLSQLMDHIDYIVKLAGVDHVGLGSDFDGIESSPKQLDDVTSYPVIAKALKERGYSKKDIKKILGGNFIRVFTANSNE
jgi:membrane dipeptidase